MVTPDADAETPSFPESRAAVVPYRTEHAGAFERLNRAWIEKQFVLEDLDKWVLQNPEEAILSKGGAILMATWDGVVAGTVALIHVGADEYELAKMAVEEAYQRRGLAEALGRAAFARARELGARKISLYSQTSLAPAIRLYRKLGFVEVPMDHQVYQRANIKMERRLEPESTGTVPVQEPRSGPLHSVPPTNTSPR